MEQIKSIWRNLSLQKSLLLCVIVFGVLDFILCAGTFALCDRAASNIQEKYPSQMETFYLTTEDGKRLGEGAQINTQPAALSEEDEQKVRLLNFLPVAATPVYSAACVLLGIALFYRSKLKKPLLLLREASEKISHSNLDFSLNYESKDEMGRLCQSFETMRSMLAANFSEMWRQIEDRKQLNAAFAHDLRTPLTVLKGYNEMLQTSPEPSTRETAITMEKHIKRLEQYVSSMSRLRRLEDMQPEYKRISRDELLNSLKGTGEMECRAHGKKFSFHDRTFSESWQMDGGFLSQVCSNLAANAACYAASEVALSVKEESGGLCLEATDDGPGFSKESLRQAATPYYTGDRDSGEHFGLGLYICRMLCEHHGGYLKIENLPTGAKVKVFFKNR